MMRLWLLIVNRLDYMKPTDKHSQNAILIGMLRRITAGIMISLISVVAFAAPADAVKASAATVSGLGNDVSYPQCKKSLPTSQAFGIVGINGGIATTTNSCAATQLAWANRSSGTTAQAKAGVYVNTANPGGLGTASWPQNNTDPAGTTVYDPYSSCDGSDSLACAWQYGWNRAVEDVQSRFKPAAQAASVSDDPAAYPWWLDVETGNTWKTGSSFAQLSNTADLEGMTAYFQSLHAVVGLYSTAAQWSQIVGSQVTGDSNLNGLNNWRPGGANLRTAQQACTAAPLTTGGKVTLTQYVANRLDYDYSCV